MVSRILILSGASGGHIVPALGLAQMLKAEHPEAQILLVLPKKRVNYFTLPEGCQLKEVAIEALKIKVDYSGVRALFLFIRGFIESLFIILEFRPQVAVGFGTIVTIPGMFWAWMFRVKTIIHEQNVILGKANKFLSCLVDAVGVSFARTLVSGAVKPDKLFFTGNPAVARSLNIPRQKAALFFGLDPLRFTFFVCPGSQGSHKINRAFLEAVKQMRDFPLQVIHLSGRADYQDLSDSYSKMNLRARVFPFLKEMDYAYCASDLAISRSGATSIAELINFRLPAIIVPYPYAAGHQKENALILSEIKAALLIPDEQLNKDIFLSLLLELAGNPQRLKQMRANYAQLKQPEKISLVDLLYPPSLFCKKLQV